jgi:hypothetical protein
MTRIEREKRTVSAMIALYCRAHHSAGDGLCEDCRRLHDYALARLERCPFGADKPTCASCPVHCYKPDLRAQIRSIMRYSGPRMSYRHPLLALMHRLDSLRHK